MQRKTLLVSLLALLLAGSASFAMAQDAGSAPAMAQGQHHGGMQQWQHGKGFEGHRGFRGPGSEVIGNLRGLERLYVISGRTKELPALYNDVLAKSQNPRVRNYVYQHLARLQAQPANVDQAIGTLRKSLDENLANEAKRRSQMEAMRAKWAQRQGNTGAASPGGN
ncbi:MAG: hypothetical protein ABW154_00875 [Dyella sp.]